jgi:molybdate transport system substrate-binding protein
VIVALALAATAGAQTRADPLTIYAAASLTEVLQAFDKAQKYNFAGSNVLETQIRNGAPADVFASASPVNTAAVRRRPGRSRSRSPPTGSH